jgi:hypothetical protein
MAVSEEKFLQIYGNILTRTWDDAELKKRFMDSPEEVLKEFGLDPGTAKVTIKKPWDDPDPKLCTPESQVAMWNTGLKSGAIDFIYPEVMPEGAEGMELSAEQLEAVAGGGDSCCCCCTPCCSSCC